jgi:hypothetical protein
MLYEMEIVTNTVWANRTAGTSAYEEYMSISAQPEEITAYFNAYMNARASDGWTIKTAAPYGRSNASMLYIWEKPAP